MENVLVRCFLALLCLMCVSLWQPVEARDVLHAGEELRSGEQLISSSGAFRLIMQDDGHLVVYRWGTPLWGSAVYGHGRSTLRMQTDGNLVVYNGANQPVWASHTQHIGTGATLLMQDDGNLVVYDRNFQAAWASGTQQNSFPPAMTGMVLLRNRATGGCLHNRKIRFDTSGRCFQGIGPAVSWQTVFNPITQADGSVTLKPYRGAPHAIVGCLTVKGKSTHSGKPIIAGSNSNCDRSAYLWRFIPDQGGYRLVNAKTLKCMDAWGSKSDELQQQPCMRTASQIFDVLNTGFWSG